MFHLRHQTVVAASEVETFDFVNQTYLIFLQENSGFVMDFCEAFATDLRWT